MMLSHSKAVIGSDAGYEVGCEHCDRHGWSMQVNVMFLDTVQMWEKIGQDECHCKRLGCGIEAESVE